MVGSRRDIEMSLSKEFIPPAAEAIELPVDDLALRLLRLLAAEQAGGNSGMLNAYGITLEGAWRLHDLGQHRTAFLQANSEAWAWLVSRGLVARKPGDTGDWAIVTRRGVELADDVMGPARLRAEERIDVDLHSRLGARIRRQFLLGEYELAAFAAMREVEIRVRELSSLPESKIGVDLMKQAFREGGPLASKELDPGERDARMALFWGAIGVFKNPSSHRQVDFGDATEASEVVLLADLLLRLLDRQEADGGNDPT
jgi:uncharacterized protein (TIGR02391 family)